MGYRANISKSVHAVVAVAAVVATTTAATERVAFAGTTITVTTTTDDNTVNGNCTLREAIEAANTDKAVDKCPAGHGADTIVLGPRNYWLGDGNGELGVASPITIAGNGASISPVSAYTYTDRDLHVFQGGTLVMSNTTLTGGFIGMFNEGTVTLTNVMVTGNGYEFEDSIAGLDNAGTATIIRSSFTHNFGSAITNEGALHIIDTTISDNQSSAEASAGITNTGNLQIATSTISGNELSSVGDRSAGGLGNAGTAILVDVTIANNGDYPNPDADTNPLGTGGLDNLGTLTMRNVTISGNEQLIDPSYTGISPTRRHPVAGLANDGGKMTLANTIVSGNVEQGIGTASPDCDGTFASLGYDLIATPANCKASGTTVGNIYGKPAKLGSLENNGGPTLTMTPRAGSPVIDKGNPAAPGKTTALCALLDQRSVPRPRDGNGDGIKRCDIGAVER